MSLAFYRIPHHQQTTSRTPFHPLNTHHSTLNLPPELQSTHPNLKMQFFATIISMAFAVAAVAAQGDAQ